MYFCGIVKLCHILLLVTLVKCDLTNLTQLTEEVAELIKSSATYKDSVNNNAYFENLVSNETSDFGTFDFIIVGGGAAGGVLANRLTELPFTVLVIEAGGETPDTSAVIGVTPYYRHTQWNWGFNTTAQNNACRSQPNNQCDYRRGKVLGGSSDINGAFYVRGNAKNYDNWEQLGNIGWSYEDVLPYFKKSEHANFSGNIDQNYHSFYGLQSISHPPNIPGLTESILDGFHELGLTELDYNGENQLGYSKCQTYLTYNIRSSTNYSFVRPIRDRPNLTVLVNSLVTKVIIEDKTAVAVKFIKNGQYYRATASKEVIMSAGAVSSPQILMLSGIGPADELEKFDIDVIADLPVGKHLVDHPLYNGMTYPTHDIYYNNTIEEIMELWSKKEGPFVVDICRGIGYVDLNNDTVPEIELFISAPYKADDSGNYIVNSLTIYVQLNMPLSEGDIRLASNDPRDYPLINPNFFDNEDDLEVLYEGVQFALGFNKTSAFQNVSSGIQITSAAECDDEYQPQTRDWWYCCFKHLAGSGYHPVGTTRMGTNPGNSVVDHNLKVHGIDRLRIVDAGVMPTIIAGHTNAPTVMIAEKIADVIKVEHLIIR